MTCAESMPNVRFTLYVKTFGPAHEAHEVPAVVEAAADANVAVPCVPDEPLSAQVMEIALTGTELPAVPTIVAATAAVVSDAVPPLVERIAPVALTVFVHATTPLTVLPGLQVTEPVDVTVTVATVDAVTWTLNVFAAEAGSAAETTARATAPAVASRVFFTSENLSLRRCPWVFPVLERTRIGLRSNRTRSACAVK